MKTEEEIVFDATLETIRGIRRVLWLITSLVCIGFFYLYLWYGSWDNARVSGRLAIVNEISKMHSRNYFYKDKKNDSIIINSLLAEAELINLERTKEKYEMPVIGLKISASDFSIGILMGAAAILTWLLFYQKRLLKCLTRLENEAGWEITIPLLQYHFVMIGSHSDKYMKIAIKSLIICLPILSFLYLCSDILDLYLKVYSDNLKILAFNDMKYLIYITCRVGWEVILTVYLAIIGLRCLKELSTTEKSLTRFLDSD